MVPIDPIRIVLVGTQHPGNIGSAARAMKTMGLNHLVLVAPRRFPDPEANALAAGAEDIVQQARVVASLDEALQGCRFALGTTARDRAISLPEHTPREAAAALLEHTADGGQAALLFGRERTGLENDELMRCHGRVFIPCNPDYASLNLASAVQVLSYEIRLRRLELGQLPAKAPLMAEAEPASIDQLERLFAHLGEFMDEIDFHKGRSPDMINQRLRRLFLRARMDEREIKIIRGLLSDAQRLLRQVK
ncbi:RNA methyltransferase [Arenimonas sp. GDDSR-1]|uniref:RNA methyltransferase n=1 Tax=Arenimonas sp. GDDSR-1 TaxID=2950125 RepID=UPI0026365004|nr:RNA methyltransferase [Arenimonas sp. GDDSR-1]